TRRTGLRSATTAGCTNGACRRSRGRFSSAGMAGSRPSSRARSRPRSWKRRSGGCSCSRMEKRALVAERAQGLRRAFEVARVARRSRLIRVLREVGVVGDRPATREAAQEFREGLEELGTTYVKLGQLLSSRPDLLPDVYIDELSKLVDDAPPVA